MTVPSPRRRSAPGVARTWSIVALTGALVAGLIGGQPAWGVESDPPPEPAASGSISGVVTTEAGEPAADVQVVAHRYRSDWSTWMWETSAPAGADGTYSLAGLRDGEYRIEFQTGYASASLTPEWWEDAADVWSATTLTVSGGTVITGISASLSAGATISGTVTDESGAPVPGVSVRAIDPAFGTWSGYTNTDAAGAYELTGLKAGGYAIEFAPLGVSGPVAGEWWDDAASRADAEVVTVSSGGSVWGIDAVLAGAGSISGVVTDTTGAPAPNAYIGVYRASSDGIGDWAGSAATDASGAYSVTGLAVGEYKVQFSTWGSLLGEWYDDAADVWSATPVTVEAGSTTSVDGELTVGATIAGVVTDEAGQPVGNVAVWARPTAGDGTRFPTGVSTSPDGTYSLSGLAPGDYRVQFETDQAATNVAGEWWNDAKTEAAADVLTLGEGESVAGVSPVLSPGAGISGVVRDGSGAPLTDAQVSLHAVDGTWLANAWTAPDGSYRFQGLDTGSYRLEFRTQVGERSFLSEWWNNAPDLASADDLVTVAGTTAEGIDAVLSVEDGSVLETNSASLSGVVTDATGNPLEGVSVSVDAGTWGDGAHTDASGAWSMTALPAGSYRVSFSAELDGALVTEWWENAADSDSATPIRLVNAEQRTGIDAVLGSAALPVLDSSIPKVTGQLRVGAAVKAHPRGWTEGTQFAFQWLADGEPIANETGASLELTPDLAGARLTVVVTGSLPGYQSVMQTSVPTGPVATR
jgi:5-hydroxyisourate hydrolase-like protein (transthyretin family)